MPSRSFAVVATLTVTALLGCGIDRGSQAVVGTAPGDWRIDERPALDPAGPTLAELQDALVEADTGRVKGLATVGEVRISHIGSYRLSQLALRLTTTVSVPGSSPLQLEQVTVDDEIYLQVPHLGSYVNKCWLTLDAETAAAATGGALPPEAVIGVPSEVAALADARRDGDDTTIDLYTAAGAFSAVTPDGLGIDYETTARVPIGITADDLAVTVSWRLADVVDAAADDGSAIPAGADDELGGGTFESTISDPGTNLLIEAPPRDRRVSFDPAASQADLDRALTECEDRLDGGPSAND